VLKLWSWISTTIRIEPLWFFRVRLLFSKPEEIKKLIERYEVEVSGIKKNAMTMSWYMRGGVTYEDVLNMSSDEHKIINEIIESNLDTTKKSQLPFF